MVGGEIGQAQREKLLLLLAAYHRLIRLPAGVDLELGPVVEAFSALLDLVELLVDRRSDEALAVDLVLSRCRLVL